MINELFYYDETSPTFLRRKVAMGRYDRYPKDSPAGNLSKAGYMQVTYTESTGKRVTTGVHRVIYELHHGSIPEGLVIDHKDCDRVNNHIDNLQVCTYSENNKLRYIRA